MKLKTNGKSIAETLSSIISSALPNFKDTGLSKHLMGMPKSESKSKGKAVVFRWNKNLFKASDSLSVTELSFYNAWEKSEDAKKVEAALKAFHDAMPSSEITDAESVAA